MYSSSTPVWRWRLSGGAVWTEAGGLFHTRWSLSGRDNECKQWLMNGRGVAATFDVGCSADALGSGAIPARGPTIRSVGLLETVNPAWFIVELLIAVSNGIGVCPSIHLSISVCRPGCSISLQSTIKSVLHYWSRVIPTAPLRVQVVTPVHFTWPHARRPCSYQTYTSFSSSARIDPPRIISPAFWSPLKTATENERVVRRSCVQADLIHFPLTSPLRNSGF